MRKLDSISAVFDKESRDPNNWPPVNTSAFTENKRRRFNAKKRALDMYLETQLSTKEILKRTGLSSSALKRLVKRAFTPMGDGSPAGYLACIPNYRLKTYTRTCSSNAGKAGRFMFFLNQNPMIMEQLDMWATGKRKIGGAPVRGPHVDPLWRAFRALCYDEGFCETDYPFSNYDGGKEAVRRYCQEVRRKSFVSSSRVEFGAVAGRLAAQSQIAGEVDSRPPLRPYERVQLDGHKVDILLTVELNDENGELTQLLLSRVWLIIALDVGSRAVLGYSISLLENYSNNDVLECVSNALSPWSPRDVSDTPAEYAPKAGIPSGVIDGCAWRCFDVLQYDNAYSHLSESVQESIISAGVNEVQTNRPASPRSNALVERFNKTFESMALHRMPMTTGSGPEDPRRSEPEKAALRYEIRLEDLELIADITIANYNATPHESLRGRSPLDYIRMQLSSGRSIPRYVLNKSVDGLKLFEKDFDVTIRCSPSQGHRPSIKFKGVRYTGEAIASRSDLRCERATFRVNIRDIRSGILFLRDGTCLGRVQAESSWMALPHSLQVRQAINKLVKQNKLEDDTSFPVAAYMAYLKRRAIKSKRARNKLLNVQLQSVDPNPNEHSNVVDIRNKKTVKRAIRSNWISIGITS